MTNSQFKLLQKSKEERIKKIKDFLETNGGYIEGKEEDCIRFIDGMKKEERFAKGSLGGKISRLRISIKNLKLNSVSAHCI